MGLRRPPIKYLNTDLDLLAAEDLLPLVRALERGGMYRLHVDTTGAKRYSILEMGKNSRTAGGHITAILNVIEKLKPRPRAIWDRCESRMFNIGYESGFKPTGGWFYHVLSPKLLMRMANLGVTLRITIFPPAEEGLPWERK